MTVMGLMMGVHDVAFLLLELVFVPYLLTIVGRVKASVLPHICRMLWGESKGMFPVECYGGKSRVCSL